MRRTPLLLVAASSMAVVLSLAGAAPALAAKGGNSGTHGGGGGTHGGGGGSGGGSTAVIGYDISYPQCGGGFPTDGTFGVVGVNDGIVYRPNPCLGTGDGPSELAWAQGYGTPAFYANTADPGPHYSSYWNITGWNDSPKPCTTTDPNSTGCSYDYGWYAAKDSFADAVAAEQQVDTLTSTEAATQAATAPWWLDVETANSWQSLESYYNGDLTSAYANDTAALRGAAAALVDSGVKSVGFYSTGYQWGQITGGAGLGTAYPDWLAGYRHLSAAQDACTSASGFSGGRVALTQYQQSGFDADVQC